MAAKMNRHDIPKTVQNVINVAIKQGVIDAIDVYGLANEHGDDWYALVNQLCEWAFTWVHCDRKRHVMVVKAAEKYWQEISVTA